MILGALGESREGQATAPFWLPSPMRQKAEQWNHGKCSIAVLLNIKTKDLLFAHLRRSTKHVLGQKLASSLSNTQRSKAGSS
ncbi:hypothetical protein DMC15_07170 [Vibrio sp. 11986-1-5]|nr:hypothetical protein DMC15_07170 [Vibrio sp. 11986-1-5]